jgi:hypothetical protein
MHLWTGIWWKLDALQSIYGLVLEDLFCGRRSFRLFDWLAPALLTALSVWVVFYAVSVLTVGIYVAHPGGYVAD